MAMRRSRIQLQQAPRLLRNSGPSKTSPRPRVPCKTWMPLAHASAAWRRCASGSSTSAATTIRSHESVEVSTLRPASASLARTPTAQAPLPTTVTRAPQTALEPGSSKRAVVPPDTSPACSNSSSSRRASAASSVVRSANTSGFVKPVSGSFAAAPSVSSRTRVASAPTAVPSIGRTPTSVSRMRPFAWMKMRSLSM